MGLRPALGLHKFAKSVHFVVVVRIMSLVTCVMILTTHRANRLDKCDACVPNESDAMPARHTVGITVGIMVGLRIPRGLRRPRFVINGRNVDYKQPHNCKLHAEMQRNDPMQ